MIPDYTKVFGEQVTKLTSINNSVRDLMNAMELDRRRKIWIPWQSGAACKEIVAWKGPVFVQAYSVYNADPNNSWFLQAHNGVSTPPENTIGCMPPLPVGPNQIDSWDGPKDGVFFSNGLYFCASSTDLPKTLATSNVLFIHAIICPVLA